MTTKKAHTKGPWKVIRTQQCGPACYSYWIGYGETEWRGPASVVDVFNQVDCNEILPDGRHGNVCITKGKQDEAKANAHLIASAPDLLAILEEFRETFPISPYGEIQCNENLLYDFSRKVDKLIDKAKGNPQEAAFIDAELAARRGL